MQQTLEGIPAGGRPSRLRIPDPWELARRFSGLAAIAVLGAAMLTLALRAEVAPTAATTPPIATLTEDASPADAPMTRPSAGPTAAPLMPAYVSPEPALVFYLFDTPDQRGIVNLAEAVAGQEAATETVVPTYRQFIALDVSTPALEQAARDTIFEAMLTDGGHTRILIHDLRDR